MNRSAHTISPGYHGWPESSTERERSTRAGTRASKQASENNNMPFYPAYVIQFVSCAQVRPAYLWAEQARAISIAMPTSWADAGDNHKP